MNLFKGPLAVEEVMSAGGNYWRVVDADGVIIGRCYYEHAAYLLLNALLEAKPYLRPTLGEAK